MINVLSVATSFSGGVLVGGALAAFIALIEVFPRFIQIIGKTEYLKFLEDVFIVSSILFSVLYFTDYYIELNRFLYILIGLILGIFIGYFSSALAETLNVLPVIAKKFKIKKKFELVVIALLLGKVAGALYYFIILIGG